MCTPSGTSSPVCSSVGLTEEQAEESFAEVETLTYDLGGNGKSQILRTAGAIELVKAGAKGPCTPTPETSLRRGPPRRGFGLRGALHESGALLFVDTQ